MWQGWICNSSICMTRRGMKPTGIAIFEAQQKGFPSVAHSVQVPRPPANMLPTHSCVLYSSKADLPGLARLGPDIKCTQPLGIVQKLQEIGSDAC